jgi:hypothetical protein
MGLGYAMPGFHMKASQQVCPEYSITKQTNLSAITAMRRRTFVAGGHITKFIGARHPDFIWKKHPDFGKKTNPTLEHYISAAVNGALESTGTAAEQVEKAWIGNFCGELFSNQGHLGAAVVGSHPGLQHTPAMRVEGACASGGLALTCAIDSIQVPAAISPSTARAAWLVPGAQSPL